MLAPNVIVLERLKLDFAGGVIFRNDPIIPKELEIFWGFDCVVRGEGEKAYAEGTLFLTNIQQFYERPDRDDDEPDAMTAVLGPKPPAKKLEITDFGDRIALRAGKLLVVNDEAHHTHEEDNEWNKVLHGLHERTPLTAQLDFSATPRFQKGAIFPWTISDYPLKQAIIDGIVKRPMKGIAKIDKSGTHWLLESKGQETMEVLRKDAAAVRWCETATQLTGKHWKYMKVPQKEFEALQPSRLSDLVALAPSRA